MAQARQVGDAFGQDQFSHKGGDVEVLSAFVEGGHLHEVRVPAHGVGQLGAGGQGGVGPVPWGSRGGRGAIPGWSARG